MTTKNPTMKTLMKATMSMKTTMTTSQHRILRIVWSCFPSFAVQSVCFQGVLRSLRCRGLLLGMVVRPCIGLCSKPVLWKKLRNSSLHWLFCQILPCRIACILVRACAFGTARPRGSAPRSFRNLLFLCGTQVISCSLESL